MGIKGADSYISILSVAPIFDDDIALDYGTREEFNISHSVEDASSLLYELKISGSIVSECDCYRVDSSVRDEYRKALQGNECSKYVQAVSLFLEHANAGFAAKMRNVLGARAARITSAVLKLALDSSQDDLNDLVEIVHDGARLGRGADARRTVLLLSELPPHPERERQQNFFRALDLWRHGDRENARENLECVLRFPRQDLAGAIAAHLLAVLEIDRGEEFLAIPLLEQSLTDLDSISHKQGRVLVLITLGRAQREIATRERISNTPTSATDYFSFARSSFNEAITLAERLGERTGLASAFLELAISYQREGDLDLAIQTAENAHANTPSTDPEIVRVLTTLGSFYNKKDRYSEAALVLEEAFKKSSKSQPNLELAKVLNVLASNERKRGLKSARQHATESVQLGRQLENSRHIAHSLNTLAATVLDFAENEVDIDLAEASLTEARKILQDLNDARGLTLIDNTQRVMQRKKKEIRGD